MARIQLFVYGTLMSDGSRRAVLAGQRFLGRAHTRPVYALLNLGAYPGLVHRPDAGQAVEGELYEIDTDLLPLLDEIEGVPGLYRRDTVELDGHYGKITAYFYQCAADNVPLYPAVRWDNTGRPDNDT